MTLQIYLITEPPFAMLTRIRTNISVNPLMIRQLVLSAKELTALRTLVVLRMRLLVMCQLVIIRIRLCALIALKHERRFNMLS